MSQKYDFSVIRSLRKRLNLTLRQLAAEAGLTYTTVENVEKNKAFPSLRTIDALAFGLHSSASELLSLCEKHVVQKKKAEMEDVSSTARDIFGIKWCKTAVYDKAKIIRAKAPAGELIKAMELHSDCFEMCYCLDGKVELTIEADAYKLSRDDTVLFDAALEHGYYTLQDCELMIVHIPKSCNVLKALVHISD